MPCELCVANSGILAVFFPSFASAALARSSHSVCADERISQVHEAASLLGKSKEECGPLRSPKSCQADKRKTAQTKQTQKRTKHPKKSAPIKRQLRWGRQLCANELRDLAKQQKNTTRHHGKIMRRCPKQSTQQRRNPGSPLPGSQRSHWEALRAWDIFAIRSGHALNWGATHR